MAQLRPVPVRSSDLFETVLLRSRAGLGITGGGVAVSYRSHNWDWLVHAWRCKTRSAVLAVVVFAGPSIGLRIYLATFTSSGCTYGALATPIAFLLL